MRDAALLHGIQGVPCFIPILPKSRRCGLFAGAVWVSPRNNMRKSLGAFGPRCLHGALRRLDVQAEIALFAQTKQAFIAPLGPCSNCVSGVGDALVRPCG